MRDCKRNIVANTTCSTLRKAWYVRIDPSRIRPDTNCLRMRIDRDARAACLPIFGSKQELTT